MEFLSNKFAPDGNSGVILKLTFNLLVFGAGSSCCNIPSRSTAINHHPILSRGHKKTPSLFHYHWLPSACRHYFLRLRVLNSDIYSISMKFTCLSKGSGYHFPPCHMINFCGLRILVDCPLDLSALAIFSPVPAALLDEQNCYFSANGYFGSEHLRQKVQAIDRNLDANCLVYAEPWYKTVSGFHLWDISLIDIVLISSPMGMLGLPFVTGAKGFSAKIYVTEASARLGQIMMEDLVSMHMEYRQFYGTDRTKFPQWLRLEDLELLPPRLKEIISGKDGSDLGGWMPLYSAADVKDCMLKIKTLKYAEEAFHNGVLTLKAFSAGLEIGSCNWILNGPKRDIAYISNSIFFSGHAMNFDYHALKGNPMIIYSDLSPLSTSRDEDDDDCDTNKNSCLSSQEVAKSLLNTDEYFEEREKLVFICSSAVECIKAGGSVLIPFYRLGTLIQLLEQISDSPEFKSMKVPIYIISFAAKELLAFLDITPEWLCKQRQERLYSGEPFFAHNELIRNKRLHVVPAVHSNELLSNWQEPCIVFAPHWSLRLGPTVHLLQRWRGDPNSLLILEEGLDPEFALLPFKPFLMKVLQCKFISGISLQKIQPLLKTLQPEIVLFPEDLRRYANLPSANSFTTLHYSKYEALHVSCQKDSTELEIATELVAQFKWKELNQESFHMSRLNGELSVYHGKHHLHSANEKGNPSNNRPLLYWGSPDPQRLLAALLKVGIIGSFTQDMSENESDSFYALHLQDPHRSLIKIGKTTTVVSAADENTASLILNAIESVLGSI